MAITLLLCVNKILLRGREAKREIRNKEYFFLWGYGRFYFYVQLSTLWSCKRILCPACCHLIYRVFRWKWYSSHLTDITLETHMTGQWNLSRSSVDQWREQYDQVRLIFQLRSTNEENTPWRTTADPWSRCTYYEGGTAFCCYKPLSFRGCYHCLT